MRCGFDGAGDNLRWAESCCLKRLQATSHQEQDGHWILCGDSDTNGDSPSMTSRSGFEAGSGRPTSLPMPTRSGSTAGAGRPTSLPATERSGSDVSGSGSMGSSSMQSGPPSGKGASTCQPSSSRSGKAGRLSSGVGSSSKGMPTQSGSRSGGTSSFSMNISTPSGSQMVGESTTSLGLWTPSGLIAPSAGTPADLASSATGDESVGSLYSGSVGSDSRGGPKRSLITNPWNFQHANRQRGLNSTALSKLYKEQKSKEH